MAYQSLGREQRIGSAAGALAVTALLGWALVNGLGVEFQRRVADSLAVFGVAPEPPPPPPVELEPNPVRDDRPEGEAAPPNIRSTPTELVAPPPVIPIPLPPPPLIVAEKPGVGSDATQGAAETPGPGTGAGGVGDGTGSGGAGDGDGGGGAETPPLWLRGDMRFSHLPRELRSRDLNNRVGLRYLVGVNGRVEACEIERPSGIPLLDRATCGIIRERYRFEPSRDARGRPVPAWVIESHEWVIETVDEDGR